MRRNAPTGRRAPSKLLGLLAALCLAACTPKKDPRHGRIVVTAPEAPPNIVSLNLDGMGQASWGTPTFATRFHLLWGTTSGSHPNVIRNVTAPFTFGGIVNGTSIYWVVQAEGEKGYSPNSAEGVITATAGSGTTDPYFTDQWHLSNTLAAGEDVDVTPVWAACGALNTCRGEGVRVAVVDSGIDITHEDLKANIRPEGIHYNFVDNTYFNPADINGHGTSVAGIIAARDKNNIGVRGVAPRANLVGYNFLYNSTLGTTANGAIALTRNVESVHVMNNSWGPGLSYLGCPIDMGSALANALDTGVTTGRKPAATALGTVYVFAAGNGNTGGSLCPSCQGISNLNTLANNRRVIAVGALQSDGNKSTYSETGSNLLVSAPGGQFCSTTGAITTTDITGTSAGINKTTASTAGSDYNTDNRNYTKCMNGTSSATPNVSGVVALLLQQYPTLGWRDVREILARSARKNDATEASWATNSAGINFNPRYGHGAVDANAALTLAATWVNRGAELVFDSLDKSVDTTVPDDDATGIFDEITVTAGAGVPTTIEYVEVVFTAADHEAPGDLEITLENRSTAGGAVSILVPAHDELDPSDGNSCSSLGALYNEFSLGSNQHLGEAAAGTWRLTVKDRAAGNEAKLDKWRLKIYGH